MLEGFAGQLLVIREHHDGYVIKDYRIIKFEREQPEGKW